MSTAFGLLLARRARVPVLASTAYVVLASFRASETGLRPLGTGILALGIATVATRRAARLPAAAWGLALVVASLGAGGEQHWLDVFGTVGAAAASIAACLALVKMTGPAGLGASRAPSAALAVFAMALAWSLALVASLGAAFGAAFTLAGYARGIALGTAFGGALILAATALRVAFVRRLELGIPTRARAAAALVGLSAALAGAASLVGSGGSAASASLSVPHAVARLGVATGAVLAGWVALHADAVRIAHVSRRVMILAFVGGPLILLGVTVTEGRPVDAAAITGLTALVALAVGGAGAALERPLRPAEGAWLDAIARAHAAILRSEPDDAIATVLGVLREPAGPTASSPELWTLELSSAPTSSAEIPQGRVTTIDAAGYPREHEGQIPSDLLRVALSEPEATLRTEILSALEVRRPDLRALARWMEDRGAFLATVILRAGEPEGILVVPSGARTEALSLEEAKAFKGLADALAALCHTRAALRRSLSRERVAVRRAEDAEDVAARFEHEIALGASRNALATTRLARPATVGVYSAASRMAYEALERRVRSGAPVALVAPSGVDPVPYLARAHLGGPRASSPLVVVDGTSSREHDLARWSDRLASPLGLADHGALVLLDGAALPPDVQRLIARALAERRVPWERAEPLDVHLVVTGTAPPEGLLEPILAARLGDALHAAIALPRLRERPEDIRAILTDRLAREGLRVRGTPVGLDDAAFSRLVEYPFAGEDAELASIVQRLVGVAGGDVVRAADVDALDLPNVTEPEEEHSRERRLSKRF